MIWTKSGLALVLIGIVISGLVSAQDSVTPTAAPSKTPTVDPLAEETQEAQVEAAPILEPWTQSDMQILTGTVQRPNGIVWFNNNLYAACTGDSTLYELDDRNGLTRTYIFGVRNAHSMYAEQDAAGELNIWVPDYDSGRFLLVQRTGVTTVSAALEGPWGIVPLNEESFVISNLRSNSLVVMNRSGEIRPVLDGLRSPTGMAANDEYVYVANNGSARRAIEWVSREAILAGEGASPETSPLISGLQNTTGLVLAPDGNLYFAYSLGTRGVVGRVNPEICREQGGCSNDEVEIVLYTDLAAPLAGLTISPDMRLFVHTMFSPDIYWLDLGQGPSS